LSEYDDFHLVDLSPKVFCVWRTHTNN